MVSICIGHVSVKECHLLIVVEGNCRRMRVDSGDCSVSVVVSLDLFGVGYKDGSLVGGDVGLITTYTLHPALHVCMTTVSRKVA